MPKSRLATGSQRSDLVDIPELRGRAHCFLAPIAKWQGKHSVHAGASYPAVSPQVSRIARASRFLMVGNPVL